MLREATVAMTIAAAALTQTEWRVGKGLGNGQRGQLGPTCGAPY